jgi:hypothetical protein
MDLIKPVNIQMMYVARAAGESVFRLALLTLPTAVVLFLVYPLRARQHSRRGISGQRQLELPDCRRHQLCRGHFRLALAIHPGTDARQVFSAGTVFRTPVADQLFPANSSENPGNDALSSTSATCPC